MHTANVLKQTIITDDEYARHEVCDVTRCDMDMGLAVEVSLLWWPMHQQSSSRLG